MSIAGDQQFVFDQLVETSNESIKKPRISYKRNFLLSLSEKDICKKLPNLPSQFDEDLLLRDSEDPPPERRGISGGFSSHGFRRNDYSSSPPTQGVHGRWEGGRSGGWNGKDNDSQSDRDQGDPGRRSGIPSRKPWQAPEAHDGLLGKGSFPKSSGFGARPSDPKTQSNDSYQLRRSNEPYQPPRPYKATPYTRHDTRESLNDETFGSSNSTSEDRAEEERKRRASFELLRKEHQKERQKSNPDLRKSDFDFSELLGESKDEKKLPGRSNEVNNTPTIPPSQSNAPRHLVPPGFGSTILERKQGDKPQTEAVGISSTDPSEESAIISSFLGISTNTVNKDKSFEKLSSISTSVEHDTVALDQKKSLETSDGSSILDKIFNTAVNLDTGDITRKNVEKVEETQSPSKTVKSSSKFAHLFIEDDNKPVAEEVPFIMPPRGGLLSLLQGAEAFATKNSDQLSNTSSTSKSVTAVPSVLTCEDLEQSILSQVSESYYPHPPPIDQVKKTKQRNTSVDNQASQHLLSLLQSSSDPRLLTVTESRPPPAPTAGETDPRKSLTLENLFGSAFMNELQSIGEPRATMVSSAPEVPLRSARSVGELNKRNERPTMGGQNGQFFHHPQQYATEPAAAHLNGSGSVFHPFDPQRRAPPQIQRFPPNMMHRPPFHHTTSGEFDRFPPHMMPKIHIQDNVQQHHLLQGFSGSHHSPFVNNQMLGELNSSQRATHHQPNYSMPPPGAQVNNPASLQAFLGIHQISGGGVGPNRQGFMGHELR